MAKYKPGQFVKVTVPGKYRVKKSKTGTTCRECALCEICGETITSTEIFNHNSCATTLGWDQCLEKVK